MVVHLLELDKVLLPPDIDSLSYRQYFSQLTNSQSVFFPSPARLDFSKGSIISPWLFNCLQDCVTAVNNQGTESIVSIEECTTSGLISSLMISNSNQHLWDIAKHCLEFSDYE
ncbi:hypothetical protein NQZ79_g258 [Umbelopsis isabellina]|nr:hypothetical protein NQZ79_g258 [Umbelopsis isabellina]